MSMTAAEIAGVVGTKYKPWFPSLVYSDTDKCYIDEATGRRVSDDIAELAFIGAALGELVNRGCVCEDDLNEYTCPTLLHALVAALNESEGT